MLKLSDRMTAPTDYLKIYPPPPNFREIYKCFIKEISVAWYTKVCSMSLHPRDLYLGITLFAPVQRLLENCLLDLSGRENQYPLVATSTYLFTMITT
jgi:hypothetical protein